MIAPSTSPLPTFVEDLLREQQDMTAVERFALEHAELASSPTERRYRSLLPATAPQPGQQYGFEVDLDRCSGCKACVTACHAMNGLDDNETWREVGLLIGGSFSLPVLQHVTTACHHCVEPGCMSACPTLAYEKDPVTGIVKHLDDQCFGCQYCVLACPYEVPKFHAAKGIVRKCDMCSSRLKAGEAPACVQACPHEAIRISLVDIAGLRRDVATNDFLPTAPSARFTIPTTKYVTERAGGTELRSGDEDVDTPEHNHVPLMVMLVLSQVAVGLFIAGAVTTTSARMELLAAGWLFGLGAIVTATAHLGRPWLAYRAVLGWRTSWLSREIIAFGALQAVATVAVVCATEAEQLGAAAADGIAWLTVVMGLTAVWCSAMIYAVTPRTYWALPYTATKFFGTTMLVAALASGLVGTGGTMAFSVVSLVALVKLIVESRQRHAPGDDRWAERSSRLLYGPLRDAWIVRCGLLMLFGIVGPMLLASAHPSSTVAGGLIAIGCLAAEFCERALFFRAAAAPRMPRGIAG